MRFLCVGPWAENDHPAHGFGVKGNPGDSLTRLDWKGKSLYRQGRNLPLLSLRQVHGDEITVFQGNFGEAIEIWERAGDAILTSAPGVAIGVFTADCLPVLLWDPEKRVIAAVHAGWRGTAREVAGKVVDKMVETFECRRENIQSALGPCIGPCCYEVDDPVRQVFTRSGFSWDTVAFFRGRGKWSLDLKGANSLTLKKAGLRKENIHLLSYCTACRSDLFFSHRREKGARGRHLNFISLG